VMRAGRAVFPLSLSLSLWGRIIEILGYVLFLPVFLSLKQGIEWKTINSVRKLIAYILLFNN